MKLEDVPIRVGNYKRRNNSIITIDGISYKLVKV